MEDLLVFADALQQGDAAGEGDMMGGPAPVPAPDAAATASTAPPAAPAAAAAPPAAPAVGAE